MKVKILFLIFLSLINISNVFAQRFTEEKEYIFRDRAAAFKKFTFPPFKIDKSKYADKTLEEAKKIVGEQIFNYTMTVLNQYDTAMGIEFIGGRYDYDTQRKIDKQLDQIHSMDALNNLDENIVTQNLNQYLKFMTDVYVKNNYASTIDLTAEVLRLKKDMAIMQKTLDEMHNANVNGTTTTTSAPAAVAQNSDLSLIKKLAYAAILLSLVGIGLSFQKNKSSKT